MAFQHAPTFLRSSIAKDPFCLGDLGPEDVLRIEAEFPTLFGEGESGSGMVVSYQTTKQENVISKSAVVPRKHDCLNKPDLATTKPFTGSGMKTIRSSPAALVSTGSLSNTTKRSQVTKSLQQRPGERNQGKSLSEMRKKSYALDKGTALSLKELKTTLCDILSRAEHIFPPEQNLTNGESQTDKEKNLIRYTHGKPDKKSYAQHIKTKENQGKNATSPIKIPANRYPNTTKSSKAHNENPIEKSFPKRNITNSSKSNNTKKIGNSTTKSNVGFFRNSIESLTKIKRKSESAPALQKTQSSSRQRKNIKKPGEDTKESTFLPNSDNDTIKQKKETIPPNKMQILENQPEKNDSFQPQQPSLSKNPGPIYFRKSAAQKFGEVKTEEIAVKDSVSRFEQLLLARTLAAKYEQKGIFHKHHTFSVPKKPDKKDTALHTNASRTLPQTLFQPTTPSCKKVLEKIAEELIYVEVLKYLDSEQGFMVEREHIKTKNEDTSVCVTPNEEYRLPEKEAADEEAQSEIIKANHERKLQEQGLSTIQEEGEESEQLVTPDLTPPVSLLNTNTANEIHRSSSSFLSPTTTSKDESTLLETPELTPVRDSPKNSTPIQSRLNVRNSLNNIFGRNTNDNGNNNGNTVSEATSDWSDFSDFLFTDVKTELEENISKSSKDKTLEELLVTPILSNYSQMSVEKSIAEKDSPGNSVSNGSSSMKTPDLSSSHNNDARRKNGDSRESNKKEVGDDEANKTIVKFTSPPAVEFQLPQKSKSKSKSSSVERNSPTVGIDSGTGTTRTSKAATTIGTTNKSRSSSAWDFTLSETEKSGSVTVTQTSYFDQGEITATTTDNLSEGEFVGKRYKSPGELSTSFQVSPGVHRLLFSSTSNSSSDESETPSEGVQGDMSSENIANIELSLGEIGGSSRSSRRLK